MKTWTLPLELPPISMFWVGWNTFREHTDPRVSGSLRLRRILPPQSYTWIYKVKTGELNRRELTLAISIKCKTFLRSSFYCRNINIYLYQRTSVSSTCTKYINCYIVGIRVFHKKSTANMEILLGIYVFRWSMRKEWLNKRGSFYERAQCIGVQSSMYECTELHVLLIGAQCIGEYRRLSKKLCLSVNSLSWASPYSPQQTRPLGPGAMRLGMGSATSPHDCCVWN